MFRPAAQHELQLPEQHEDARSLLVDAAFSSGNGDLGQTTKADARLQGHYAAGLSVALALILWAYGTNPDRLAYHHGAVVSPNR